MTNDPSDEKGQPQGGGTSSGASGDPHPDHESDTINFGKSADFRRRVLDVNSILSGMRRAETVDPSRIQLGQDETAAISPGHSSGQGTIDSGEEIRRKKKSLQGE
ncbi:MAG TPA: hypothetical protein V6C72_09275, partial [Chroococcales cyanobacterium]